MKFKFLPHTADIKFQAFGRSVEEAFINSFFALKQIMFEDLGIKHVIRKKIKVNGKDLENLLYNFLEEFLYLLDAKQFIPLKINKIKINEKKLELNAEVIGDNARNYTISNPVKAITYNEMIAKFDAKKKEWIIQVVVDV